jgi:hypothetical protein
MVQLLVRVPRAVGAALRVARAECVLQCSGVPCVPRGSIPRTRRWPPIPARGACHRFPSARLTHTTPSPAAHRLCVPVCQSRQPECGPVIQPMRGPLCRPVGQPLCGRAAVASHRHAAAAAAMAGGVMVTSQGQICARACGPVRPLCWPAYWLACQ